MSHFMLPLYPPSLPPFPLCVSPVQILMDDDKREQYDRYGSTGLQEGFMDPGAFFTMSFGADKFESLVRGEEMG